LVDATDLDAYAEQRPREAQELLPHLVRRLLANTPGVTGVSVRTGSSIGMTGYDGQAHGGAGTSFVPVGQKSMLAARSANSLSRLIAAARASGGASAKARYWRRESASNATSIPASIHSKPAW